MHRYLRYAAVMLTLVGALAACGDNDGVNTSDRAEEVLDDARRRAREAADAVEKAGEGASARLVAEALRAALVVEDLGRDEELRDIDVLREAVDDLPGDPEVSGLEDTDGDGRDDDGRVQIIVDGERACLTVPEDGGDTEVKSGAC